MNKKTTWVAASILFLMQSCGGQIDEKNTNENANSNSTTQEVESIQSPKEIRIDTVLTSFTQFIAGNGGLNQFEDSSDLKWFEQWAKDNADKFNKIKIDRLDKIGKWNQENLQRLSVNEEDFCFYPLAGGDFIHVSYLFPKAKNYLMLALEPVGSIPNLNTLKNKEDFKYLENVDKVLRNIYRQSYFVTKNMDQDIRGAELVDGVLPLILWGMGKTDHSIVGLEFFDIDTSGNKKEVAKTKKPTGVHIDFVKNGSSEIKTLEYLSVNIVDRELKAHPEVEKYIMNHVPENCNSFMKSASYVLHYGGFSKMRDLIVSKTKYHLQDDTGIPYKYFKATFQTNLFGQYVEPVDDFSSNLFQKDLDSAYSNPSLFKGDLPFSMGYHWGSRKQNQMIFYKK